MTYRVSTITATASVVVVQRGSDGADGGRVDLDGLFDRLTCSSYMIGIKYKDREKAHESVVPKKPRKNSKKAKQFDNQLSLVFFDSIAGKTNVKVFCNGRVQLTGIKTIEAGPAVLAHVCDVCGFERFEDYRVRMINSDWKMIGPIRLDATYQRARGLGLKTRYEPCMYPGVLVKYPVPVENGQPRILTMMIFRTGSVVITGALDMAQLDAATAYCRQVLLSDYTLLRTGGV
jgi:TATA-box binding protein (TBP) (component of TFIID and TFIIIB)